MGILTDMEKYIKGQQGSSGGSLDAQPTGDVNFGNMFSTMADHIAATKANGSKMKKGGSVSARADGIAQRGKTRGKIC